MSKLLTQQEIIDMYGNPFGHIDSDGHIKSSWEEEILVSLTLPEPLPLSFDLAHKVKRIRCHKKVAYIFNTIFKEIYAAGLWRKIISYGGCYEYRRKRWSKALSHHAWGIAVDLFFEGELVPEEIVTIFKRHGCVWGGDWTHNYDPMHFEIGG